MRPRRNPPLIAARSFEAAARHGSFQRAAQELHVTPTAISHQVKRLEEYLGTQLFVRKNRTVDLTEDGRALAARLDELFSALEDVLDPSEYSEEKPLRITAMPSLAAKWLAHRIANYAPQSSAFGSIRRNARGLSSHSLHILRSAAPCSFNETSAALAFSKSS
jgi:LysR family glycine cleavage system transcriptional activator